jgi:hypothetical protein
MRKLIATLAVALSAAGLSAAPSQAAAAGCSKWLLPTSTQIRQSNGYTITLAYSNGRWYVPGNAGAEVTWTSKRPSALQFIITWPNGAGGVYTGSIDPYGFISGTTVDRWKPSSRAYWKMSKVARCSY